MKLSVTFIACLVLLTTQSSTGAERLVLNFFGSPTCGECFEIKNSILFPARDSNPDKIELRIYDVDSDSGFNLLLKMEDQYGVETSASIELFFPDTFLTGGEDILKYSRNLINNYLKDSTRWNTAFTITNSADETSFSEKLKEKFRSYSFFNILIAGLVDGINPCAIATLVFLVSFLATKKHSKKQILVIGTCFTISVFLTYLFMGIGAFRIVTALDQYSSLSKIIKYSAAAFAAIVGILSLIDALRFRKSRKVQDIKLQLPKPLKLGIHKVITGNLSGGQLATGAFVTGFLVTLLEAVCTGQVYLPTIVLMTKQQGLRFIGWIYLIFYNVLFVIPLIIVMMLAYYGMRWEQLAKTTQKHMVLLKSMLGFVLIGLAVFLLIAG